MVDGDGSTGSMVDSSSEEICIVLVTYCGIT
jgi:hypothetical protein